MASPEPADEILDWLQQRGYSSDEIAKIQTRLAQYDQAIVRTALFESVGEGQLDLDAIIEESLKEQKE